MKRILTLLGIAWLLGALILSLSVRRDTSVSLSAELVYCALISLAMVLLFIPAIAADRIIPKAYRYIFRFISLPALGFVVPSFVFGLFSSNHSWSALDFPLFAWAVFSGIFVAFALTVSEQKHA